MQSHNLARFVSTLVVATSLNVAPIGAQSDISQAPQSAAQCGGIVTRGPGRSPSEIGVQATTSPLNFGFQWDATLSSDLEPFAITAGVNDQLRFTLSGTPIPAVTLTATGSVTTSLSNSITAVETTALTLASTSGINAPGIVRINGENIYFASKTSSELRELTRGYAGTVAVPHASTSTVALQVSAAEVARNLSASSTFIANADVFAFPPVVDQPNNVVIRTRNAVAGTIRVEPTANSAHAEFGYPLSFTIFESVGAAQKQRIGEAADEWAALIHRGNYTNTIVVRAAYFPANPGGTVATGGTYYSGGLISGGELWFDATENWHDSVLLPVPGGKVDLLTVARHELGHVIGWNGDSSTFSNFDPTTNTTLTQDATPTSTTIFVADTSGFPPSGSVGVNGEEIVYASKTPVSFESLTRPKGKSHEIGDLAGNYCELNKDLLNIRVRTYGSHSDPLSHVDDIMNPGIPGGIRRPISLYPGVAHLVLTRSADASMEFLDWNHVGSETGSVFAPWTDFATAVQSVTADTLFITPNTFLEAPITVSLPFQTITDWTGASIVVR